jgi:hypothetical protein
VIVRLALRNLLHRPGRALFLLGGYALGVGVMITLLAIGEAMLTQARDERLIGGGDVTVLPEGLDLEVMKTGGVGGMFFAIARSRFVYRQLLASPRFEAEIAAAAPQIEGALLYLRHGDIEIPVRASGGIPSLDDAVGASPPLTGGEWVDDEHDRRWMAPTPYELYAEIDRFHLPPPYVEDRESWGEWHYFNVLYDGGRRWAFVSLIIGGDVPEGEWGGQVQITLHGDDQPDRRFLRSWPSHRIAFSTTTPDLVMGASRVELLPDGRYRVEAEAAAERGSGSVKVEMIVTPAPRAYFPASELASGAFTSGYTVPALRADADGRVCVNGACSAFTGAQAYHDHNWGVWRGVTWEWGQARAGELTLLYGRVHPPAGQGEAQPLFLYVVDSLGFRALLRPREIRYDDAREIVVDGERLRVPARAVLSDVRGADTLVVELDIEHATATDTWRQARERGAADAIDGMLARWFVQMKGVARVRGRLGGTAVSGVGQGFFETFR